MNGARACGSRDRAWRLVTLCSVLVSGCGSFAQRDLSESELAVEPALAAAITFDSDGDGVHDVRDRCSDTPSNLLVGPRGCPLFGVIDGLAFAPGSAELSDEAKALLGNVVRVLKRHPDKPFRIGTHTDALGDADYNRALSRARALAIARYLYTAGIPRERMTAIAFGEARPIASNDTPDGRRANRRVTILVER